jgi:hypothetical protein
MRAFLTACVVAIVIGVGSKLILDAIAQKPVWAAFATEAARNTPPAQPQQ